MKVVILAGGYGTRISEETAIRPKPMVEIGDKPVLWHIMKIYAAYGHTDFVVCAGYKGYQIMEYFSTYFRHVTDVTFDLAANSSSVHASTAEPWRVRVVDTGENTMTGGRLKRVRDHLSEETFCMAYGDCVASVDIGALVDFHRREGALGTLTAVQPPGRFGALTLEEGESQIRSFREKPSGDGTWVNGGFFVLEPAVIDYIDDDSTVWEREPMERLANDGALTAYRHEGFWHPMDTLRDKMVLDELWNSSHAPWRVW